MLRLTQGACCGSSMPCWHVAGQQVVPSELFAQKSQSLDTQSMHLESIHLQALEGINAPRVLQRRWQVA